MQQITWNASADAKAFRAITGTMPITLDNNPKATAATDNNKRKREDNNPKAEKEAKKVSDRTEKIATALAKEDASAKDNSWEVNVVMNAIVKCSLFTKDYNNDEDDSKVKEI